MPFDGAPEQRGGDFAENTTAFAINSQCAVVATGVSDIGYRITSDPQTRMKNVVRSISYDIAIALPSGAVETIENYFTLSNSNRSNLYKMTVASLGVEAWATNLNPADILGYPFQAYIKSRAVDPQMQSEFYQDLQQPAPFVAGQACPPALQALTREGGWQAPPSMDYLSAEDLAEIKLAKEAMAGHQLQGQAVTPQFVQQPPQAAVPPPASAPPPNTGPSQAVLNQHKETLAGLNVSLGGVAGWAAKIDASDFHDKTWMRLWLVNNNRGGVDWSWKDMDDAQYHRFVDGLLAVAYDPPTPETADLPF